MVRSRAFLVEVDEDTRAPFFLPPRRRHRIRCAALDFPGQRNARPTHLDEVPVGGDAQEYVNPSTPGCLRITDQTEVVQHGPEHIDGDRTRLHEAGARLRI